MKSTHASAVEHQLHNTAEGQGGDTKRVHLGSVGCKIKANYLSRLPRSHDSRNSCPHHHPDSPGLCGNAACFLEFASRKVLVMVKGAPGTVIATLQTWISNHEE